AKPGFFHEENRANLFEVVPETGMLLNTDNGSPMPQVGNISARLFTEAKNQACQVFQNLSIYLVIVNICCREAMSLICINCFPLNQVHRFCMLGITFMETYYVAKRFLVYYINP
ncbi:cytosolic purine 5'-nucleotidase-like, partial [Trifolium medium]|nr:cytosolic purine 5'-nucleotidase-like [Trifolium medium]